MKSLLSTLLVLSLISCSSGPDSETDTSAELPEHLQGIENLTVFPADAEPAYSIDLIREHSYGDNDDIFINYFEQFSVDKSGRVFIPEIWRSTVHVFLPDGNYITSIGREGNGPGEFSGTPTIVIQEGRLYAFDSRQLRFSMYSLDSNISEISEIPADDTGSDLSNLFPHLETVMLSRENFNIVRRPVDVLHPTFQSVTNEGNIVLMVRTGTSVYRENPEYDGSYRYFNVEKDGDIAPEVILEQKLPPVMFDESNRFVFEGLPFLGAPLTVFSDNDWIYSVSTDDFLVRIYNEHGEYQRAFYYPIQKKPLIPEEAIYSLGDFEPIVETLKDVELPDTWPALESMVIDDENRIWVSTLVEDSEIYGWWILDEYGNLLTRFDWPRERVIKKVKNGKVFSLEADEENGSNRVVQYHIQLTDT